MIGKGGARGADQMAKNEVNWFKDSGVRVHRQRLIPSQRIDLIYESAVHGCPVNDISKRFGIEKQTVNKVLIGYQSNYRVYKLLPTHTKIFLLKNRRECLSSQK